MKKHSNKASMKKFHASHTPGQGRMSTSKGGKAPIPSTPSGSYKKHHMSNKPGVG